MVLVFSLLTLNLFHPFFLVFLSLTLSKEILAWYYLAYRFADSTSKTMQKHFKGLIEGEGRIEFFPIEWRTKLRLDEGSWFGVYFSHFAILVANICSKSTIQTLKKRCKICSKLTIKTPERRHSGDLLLALNIFHIFFIVDFEQVNVSWVSKTMTLTHFTQIFHLCTPWKRQKTRDCVEF